MALAARVYHLGDMAGAPPGARSYEGRLLSVSVHPAAWERIARLGGAPLHGLARRDGRTLAMVDVHALRGAAHRAAREAVVGWAAGRGLVAVSAEWEARRWDPEEEAWTSGGHATEAEAWEAAGAPGGPTAEALRRLRDESDGGAPRGGWVRRRDALRPTEAGCAATGGRMTREAPGIDAAATLWAEDACRVGHPVDGAWWRDDLRPEAWSAPRGGLCAGTVRECVATPCGRWPGAGRVGRGSWGPPGRAGRAGDGAGRSGGGDA